MAQLTIPAWGCLDEDNARKLNFESHADGAASFSGKHADQGWKFGGGAISMLNTLIQVDSKNSALMADKTSILYMMGDYEQAVRVA